MPARVVIDREAFDERVAIMTADGIDTTWAAQQASLAAYNTPFALAATALANGDDDPARELCRREAKIHGRQWAMELRDAIREAVNASLEPLS